MTREYKIKELAHFLQYDCLNKPNDYCEDSDCYMCRATALYDTGWHKQIEAEWIPNDVYYSPMDCYVVQGYTCSHCKTKVDEYTNYCSYCGAKMTIKGE